MPESKSRKKPAYTPPPKSAEAKPNPAWYVPTFLTLLIVGLVWVVVTYISQSNYPVPGIGNFNLAIGFAFILVGFVMTMRWR
ncbi:protein of unknown function UPF0233 [Beutenbergia cavernae DSM 12333]|uniref:Cell division protein CrgA n=1 Tax=Beutenbergia cavernae (strain ATCC BAA-8 / DSM 12333 / CCUG 43141 / JCM 11478 / NBRC 16432 / NCIMB 13614 / HKI 0122) TaxID=471853 RepID=C5BUR3_BEUC1|nr:cell division protein CrgA [Beutenbergia cavernae]ACQ78287.1 protein of unknown function UPF0233 [Beutenbergia cavernae DSM 12333]